MRILQLHLSISKGGAYTVVKNLTNGFKKLGHHSQEIFSNSIDSLKKFNYDGVLLHSFQGRYIDEYLESLQFLEQYKIPYIVLLHDYWPICLQTNLVRCNDGFKECKNICDPFGCGFYNKSSESNIDYIDIQKHKEIYGIIKDSKTSCFNQYSIDIFKNHNFNNIKLIHHGIDLDLFKPTYQNDERFTILFTNAWGEKELKGFKHWEWFKKHNNNICKDLLGDKTLEYMPFFYNSGDCLLFLSLWPETCGLVILEALACDIPVISYPVGIASEIIKNNKNGYLIDTFNISDVLNAVEKIKDNEFDCRNSVLEFSLENMCKKYIEFLI